MLSIAVLRAPLLAPTDALAALDQELAAAPPLWAQAENVAALETLASGIRTAARALATLKESRFGHRFAVDSSEHYGAFRELCRAVDEAESGFLEVEVRP